MGLVSWLLLILIFTFILFAAFSFFLNRFYPEEEAVTEEELSQRRRKWVGIFILIATISIITLTGINALLHTQI